MKELALHILDIAQNSITADATLIEIEIRENTEENVLLISIRDNGCGMNLELLEKVTDPFVTTRTTRKVGLGISLFKAAAERCNGSLFIDSDLGKGTVLKVNFDRNHIDRAPLGNMADTMVTLIIAKDSINYIYRHTLDKKEFELDTRRIREILGEDVPLGELTVLDWIKNYIIEGIRELTNNLQ